MADPLPNRALPYGFELQFRLRFAELTGDAFQDFFCQVMERRDSGFRRVRPWGNEGDRKNDGWSPDRRMLFQSYAPSSLRKAELLAKMEVDYVGAADYWEEYFDEWIFVHNDADGLAPEVALKIEELDDRHPSIACRSWGREQIRREMAHLDEASLVAILGPPITADDFLDVSAQSLQPLFQHMQSAGVVDGTSIKPVPIDKIQRNNLSHAAARFLQLGEGKMPLVEDYLKRASADPRYEGEIAAAFSAKYGELRGKGFTADQVFDGMLAWVTAGTSDADRLASSLSAIAYFFFTCQIFEEHGA